MSFGQNLQFLRRMRNQMTQEELAEKLDVSRQTISKWELDAAWPEMEKLLDICKLFSCTLDELVRSSMIISDESFSNLRTEWVEPLRFIRYAVVSAEPEEDAIRHVREWAKQLGIDQGQIIGWDFPVLSQEQINVYNMHGYAAALLLPENITPDLPSAQVVCQSRQKYIAITIREPHIAPFRLIPNAYKALNAYMHANGLSHDEHKGILPCFEKEYTRDGRNWMDVYIAIK